MKEINKEAIYNLIKIIQRLQPKEFDMRNVVSLGTFRPCGICALGHTLNDPYFKSLIKTELKKENDDAANKVVLLEKIFGISKKLFDDLFCVTCDTSIFYGWTPVYAITKEMVIGKLENILEND